MSTGVSLFLLFRYSSLTCFANFAVFLKFLLRCWAKSLRPARYLASLLRSLSFPQSFPSFPADKRYSCIPFEMSYAYKPCYDIDTAVFLCCFFRIMIFLHSHNTGTLLLFRPSLLPTFFPYSTTSFSSAQL